MHRLLLSAAALTAAASVLVLASVAAPAPERGEPTAPAEPRRPRSPVSASSVLRAFEGPERAESGVAFFHHDSLATLGVEAGLLPYLPFLETPTFRGGLYALGAGARDFQEPHAQDEIYVVMRGKAVLVAGDQRTPVEPGSVAFVAAGIDHRFIDVEEELSVLVFFAGH